MDTLIEALMHEVERRRFSIILGRLALQCEADALVLKRNHDPAWKNYLFDESRLLASASNLLRDIEDNYPQEAIAK